MQPDDKTLYTSPHRKWEKAVNIQYEVTPLFLRCTWRVIGVGLLQEIYHPWQVCSKSPSPISSESACCLADCIKPDNKALNHSLLTCPGLTIVWGVTMIPPGGKLCIRAFNVPSLPLHILTQFCPESSKFNVWRILLLLHITWPFYRITFMLCLTVWEFLSEWGRTLIIVWRSWFSESCRMTSISVLSTFSFSWLSGSRSFKYRK